MREPARRRLLDEVAAAFVTDGRARGLSPRTISSYLEAVASFRASLEPAPGEQTLASLTLDAGRAWAVGLAVGRRPATVANRIRALKVLSTWCVDEGYLAADPLARLRRPSVPRTAIIPFSEAQVRALLEAAPPPLAITLQILLDTGLRISEAVGLCSDDVLEGFLRVTGKGGHERVVPVGRTLEAALRRYRDRGRPGPRGAGRDALLLSRSRRPQTARSVYSSMRRAAAAAGVEGVRVSPHTCRHTFAITFLRNGGNLLALQRILGHQDLAMVRRYAELVASDLAAAQATASPLDGWARSENRRDPGAGPSMRVRR
jgi:site-specific recombinase XerD